MLAQTTGTTFDVASVIEEATGGETIANNPCAAADKLVVAQGQKIDLTPAVEHGSGRAQSDDLADPTGERGAQVLHELSLDDCSRETTAEAGPGHLFYNSRNDKTLSQTTTNTACVRTEKFRSLILTPLVLIVIGAVFYSHVSIL